MIVGRWFLTPHALERFRQHYARRLKLDNRKEALAWIADDAAAAKLAYVNRHKGGETWVGRRPLRIRYVLGDVPDDRKGTAFVRQPVVTILGPSRGSGSPRADR